MLGRETATGNIVAADGAIELLRKFCTPNRQRDPPPRELVQLIVMVPLPDQDDADHTTAVDQGRDVVEPISVDARHQHVVVAIRERIGEAAEHA